MCGDCATSVRGETPLDTPTDSMQMPMRIIRSPSSQQHTSQQTSHVLGNIAIDDNGFRLGFEIMSYLIEDRVGSYDVDEGSYADVTRQATGLKRCTVHYADALHTEQAASFSMRTIMSNEICAIFH